MIICSTGLYQLQMGMKLELLMVKIIPGHYTVSGNDIKELEDFMTRKRKVSKKLYKKIMDILISEAIKYDIKSK